MAISHFRPRARAWLAALAFIAAPALMASAFAQDDPPGRVGRLAESQGVVTFYDAEQGQWNDAERNRPLTTGDRLSTAARATAEMRVGSTVVRLSEGSELEMLRIDDERIALRLHRGSLALQVRAREVAAEIELVTAEATLRPQRAGLFRLDRADDVTQATAWRGALRVDERGGFTIEAGQRLELWRDGGERADLRSRLGAPLQDGFAAWVAGLDRPDERTASSPYVSPEMTGAEELDRHGRWEQHPEYGAIWLPAAVREDWAPYRYGHWAWVRPWGWTWVDDAPWGFAPFHYGRWVHWGGRWGWCPGDYVRRPVYAPALVAFVGGAHVGVTINLGSPAVAWVPLAPREIYRPWYRATPAHEDRVNHRPPRQPDRGGRAPQQTPTGPVMYGNQGVPGAVTAVPRDVLMQRQPVAREAIDGREPRRPGANWTHERPPERRIAPPPVLPQPSVPAPTAAAPETGSHRIAPERERGRERLRDMQRDVQRDTARDVPRVVGPAPRPVHTPAPVAAPQPVPQPAAPAAVQPAVQPAAQPAIQPPAPPLRPAPAVQPRPRPPEADKGDKGDKGREDDRKGRPEGRGNPRERESVR